MAKKGFEHLIILEKSVIDKKLKHSLFDNQSKFSNLQEYQFNGEY